MKQVKILYEDLSVGFFTLNENNEITGYGFHVEDNDLIDKIILDYPIGTQIELIDNYYRIHK